MTREDTEVVKAAVTSNHSVPPRNVLDRVGAEGVPASLCPARCRRGSLRRDMSSTSSRTVGCRARC